jgi:hypothetical protein
MPYATVSQAQHAVLERPGRRETADLGSGGGGSYGERGKSTVDPDKPGVVVGEARWVAAVRVEVRRLDVEADVPASAMPTTGREQDPGPRGHHELPGASIVLRDRAEQPPQPAVSSWTRTVPILGSVTERGWPSPTRIEQAPLLPTLLRSRKLSRQ